MIKEVRGQAKIGVGIETLWRALSKNVSIDVPNCMPHLVKQVEVIGGDVGLGTILIFKFFDTWNMLDQKEMIIEYDETKHKIGLEVMEGGKLNMGFDSYTTFFELNVIGDEETLVDIKVVYGIENEEASSMPLETTNPTLFYLNCLEKYLLSC